jgi:hypothetical protein
MKQFLQPTESRLPPPGPDEVSAAVGIAEPSESQPESQQLSQTASQQPSQQPSQKLGQKVKVTFRFSPSRIREARKATTQIQQTLKQRHPRLRFHNEDFYDLAAMLFLSMPAEERQRHAEEFVRDLYGL